MNVKGMGVVQAKIQTVEDAYRLVWTAVASKWPIEAIYHGLLRLFCPTGWAGIGQKSFEFCVISRAARVKRTGSGRVPGPLGAARGWRSRAE